MDTAKARACCARAIVCSRTSPAPKRRKASRRWSSQAPPRLDDLLRGTPLVLLMAGVQDPGNVGALVRTAEALGATGAAACSAGGIGTANPFGPKALRASAGAALRLPILRGVATPILLAQLRVAGVRVYAASSGCSECPGAVGCRLARARQRC